MQGNVFVASDERPDLGGNLLYGDPASFSPKVLEYTIQRFSIRSVLDVGAGLGHLSRYIYTTHNIPVIGVEGLQYNCSHAVYPLLHHDLTKNAVYCPVDLVCCVEVVEHIQECYIDNLLNTLANGQIVLMTHALPGQNGYSHVNEQTSEYWIAAMERVGYTLLVNDTNVVRRIAAAEVHGGSYFCQSGLVFARSLERNKI